MNIENRYKVRKLIYKACAHVYCPLGKDWGVVDITAEIFPSEYLPDYLDIDEYIKKEIEGSEHITEEVGYMVYDFIVEQIKPAAVYVDVHSNNDSMHDCVTTIGGHINE